MPAPWQDLRRYIVDCQRLERDLHGLIEDLRFQLDHPDASIRYAVDYAEIHAYVFGREIAREDTSPRSRRSRTAAADMNFFADDPEATAQLVEHEALARLFARPDSAPLLLLEPYQVECLTAIDRYRERRAKEVAERTGNVLSRLMALQGRTEYSRIRSLGARVSRGESNLSDRDLDFALHFFEEKAGDILWLLNEDPSEIEIRAKHVFNSDRLQLVDQVHGSELVADEDTAQRWLTALRASRRDSTSSANSYLDAVAVGLLKSANVALASNTERWRLISRSEHMHRIFDESQRSEWQAAGGWPLRHPRCLAVIGLPQGSPRRETLQELQRVAESLAAVSEAAEHCRSPAGDPHDRLGQEVLERVEMIKREWRHRLSLSSSLSEADRRHSEPTAASRPRSAHDVRQTILAALNLVWNSDQLSEKIRERIRDLTHSVVWGQDSLGLRMVASVGGNSAFIEGNLSVTDIEDVSRFGRKSVARADLDRVPYALQFYTDFAKRLVAEGQEGKVGWVEILRALDEAALNKMTDVQVQYEALLAIAYMLAILAAWDLAEVYCKLACGEAAGARETKAHEALFLWAVCLRLNQPKVSPQRLREARRLLAEAAAAEPRSSAGRDFIDPRYLKEEAALVFTWHEKVRAGMPDWLASTDQPPASIGIDLSRRALAITQEQQVYQDLRIQLLNNLCYHYVGEYYYGGPPAEESRAQAEEYLAQFQNEQSALVKREELWSADYLDTVAWGHWVLRGQELTQDERQACMRRLELAMSRLSDGDPRRKLMKEHYDIVALGGTDVDTLAPSGHDPGSQRQTH
jgi:hypothetical protein